MRSAKTLFFAALTASAAVALGACGSSKSDDSGSGSAESTLDGIFSKTAVKGKFGGTAWTYASGRALPTGSGSGDTQLYTIELVSEAVEDPCSKYNFEAADKKKVTLVTPMAVAEQTLDKTHPAAFLDNSGTSAKATTVTEGKSKIVEKSKAQVRGRLTAEKDADNTVNGTFTISLCCDADDGVTYQACK